MFEILLSLKFQILHICRIINRLLGREKLQTKNMQECNDCNRYILVLLSHTKETFIVQDDHRIALSYSRPRSPLDPSRSFEPIDH